MADNKNFQTAPRIKGVLAVVQAGSGEDAKIEVKWSLVVSFPFCVHSVTATNRPRLVVVLNPRDDVRRNWPMITAIFKEAIEASYIFR